MLQQYYCCERKETSLFGSFQHVYLFILLYFFKRINIFNDMEKKNPISIPKSLQRERRDEKSV